MSRRRVLVVEDNAMNQKLVSRFLEAKGFVTFLSGSTAEAEQWLASQRADLILMDVSLPGEDGLSLVRRLRASASPRVPIIAVTAHAMPGDRELALGAGCDDYLAKPIELSELLALMLRHLPRVVAEAAT